MLLDNYFFALLLYFIIVGLHNPVLQLIHFKEKRVFPMKYNTCPRCKTKVSDDLAQCPECGHSFGTRKNHIPVVLGSCLLIAAFAGGLAFNLGSELHNAVPSAAPEINTLILSLRFLIRK